jgi:hypothetical protein
MSTDPQTGSEWLQARGWTLSDGLWLASGALSELDGFIREVPGGYAVSYNAEPVEDSHLTPYETAPLAVAGLRRAVNDRLEALNDELTAQIRALRAMTKDAK